MSDETKQCPYCAEDIRAEAIKCKHCGEMLGVVMPEPEEPEVQEAPRAKSVSAMSGVVILVAGGFGIYMVSIVMSGSPMLVPVVFLLTWIGFARLGKYQQWTKTISAGGGFIVACFAVIGAVMIGGPSVASSSAASAPAAPVTISDATCKADLKCWGDRHSIPAGVRCANPVERLALNSHNWTDGFFESKFPRFGWKDKAAGTLTYIGDSIQFQNGFGAMVNHRYECDYDPGLEEVIAVRAAPGRMR